MLALIKGNFIMSKCKAGFVGALMLMLTGSSAGAADLFDDDFRGSMKDMGTYEETSTRGWYLRGDLGYGYNSDPTATDSNGGIFAGEDLDDSFVIGGGIGYNLTRGLRMDFTLDYRNDADLYAVFPASPTTPLTGELSTLVGMANLYYDFDMGHRITPYVGVGIGFASHTMDAGKLVSGADLVDYNGKTDTNFAWALMAGVDVDLRSNWKLDIGYRYLNMGEHSSVDVTTGTKTFDVDDIESHEFRVGLRYQLGCLRGCTPDYVSYK